MGVVEKASTQDVLKAFAASMSTADLSAASGAQVSLETTISPAGKVNVEILSPSYKYAFNPEVGETGDVVGNLVATDARGNTTETPVAVKVSDSGVSGKVGGSNVAVSANSVAVSQPDADSVEIPTAAEATSAAETASDDTVGEGKEISPEA